MKPGQSGAPPPPPLLDKPIEHVVHQSKGLFVDTEVTPKRMKLGLDLLKKAGYVGVGGLGKKENGMSDPVSIVAREEGVGLGFASSHGPDSPPGEEKKRNSSNVVAVRNIPSNATESEVLQLAQPWGPLVNFAWMPKLGMGVIGMPSLDAADEMVEFYEKNPVSLHGEEVAVMLGQPGFVFSKKHPLIEHRDESDVAFVVGSSSVSSAPHENDGMSLLLKQLGMNVQKNINSSNKNDAMGIVQHIEGGNKQSNATSAPPLETVGKKQKKLIDADEEDDDFDVVVNLPQQPAEQVDAPKTSSSFGFDFLKQFSTQ